MWRPRAKRTARGFTLVELLVVLVLLAIAIGLGVPALQNMLLRSRLQGMSQELSVMIQRARLEAIKRRVPTVVRIDPVDGTAVAWVDLDGVAVGDPPDSIYNPIAGELRLNTDFELSRLEPRSNVGFGGPPGDAAPAQGLSTDPNGETVLVFLPTGAAAAEGAFRIRDVADLNHLEIRIAPAGTGRVDLRKWDRDDAAWTSRREGGEAWKWYSEPAF